MTVGTKEMSEEE